MSDGGDQASGGVRAAGDATGPAGGRRSRLPSATLLASALLAGGAATAASYLLAGPTEGFPVTLASDLLVRGMPAAVVTLTITRLGDLGQVLALVGAVALVTVGYGLVALAALLAGARSSARHRGALLALAGGWLATLAAVGTPLLAVGPGAAMAVVVWVVEADRPAAGGAVDPARRRTLELAAGVGLFGVLASVVRLSGSAPAPDLGLDGETAASVEELLALADERSLDLPALGGLVVPAGEFYEVDINTVDPRVDVEGWTLSVTGAVDRELELTYDELRARPMEHRFNTLRCVGEPLNGKKMDNALWTGTPLMGLLEEAGPRGEFVVLRSADGYEVGFALDALEPGLLAYGMNGETLPTGHGYPVRALVPGHWGEVNSKWLTEIEVTEQLVDGYWERRGWHGTGPVNTVAKIHHTRPLGGGRVEVGGHAYAGTRGVSAVEVSTDSGATWERATLSGPLPGDDVWRQWVHEVDLDGETRVVARAIEADGTVQPRTSSRSFPSGPSGWVRVSISPGE